MWRIGAAALSLVLLAAPAAAQKQGGTATLGLELDIPGLDQLKVGVYDTAATSAAALLFDTLTRLIRAGKAQEAGVGDRATAGRGRRPADYLSHARGDLPAPHVKGFDSIVNSCYNGWRFEDLWLDK